jgi:hypothetical protein
MIARLDLRRTAATLMTEKASCASAYYRSDPQPRQRPQKRGGWRQDHRVNGSSKLDPRLSQSTSL